MEDLDLILIKKDNNSFVLGLEEKYSIQLPPIFKEFASNYEFGKFNIKPKHWLIHPNKEICFDEIYSDLENQIKIYFDQGDYYQDDKIIPIGFSCYSGGICVGLDGDLTDKIILYVGGNEEKLRIIASDIFDFLRQLEQSHWDNY